VGEATLCPLPIEETGDPLPIKSGAVLLTLQDARDHILMLGAQRETRYWQHVHGMISAQVDVLSVTNQFHRAL
jgi:hypothetical protein